MGCDIHAYVEVKKSQADKWEQVKDFSPFHWRSYAVFGFLADVRNYSHCTPISEPKGLPDDLSPEVAGKAEYWDWDGHSHSWLTLKELLGFDYDKVFWDRRVSKQVAPNVWNGTALALEGEGQHITYREHLGAQFFRDLETLKTFGEPENVRVVFWFDN